MRWSQGWGNKAEMEEIIQIDEAGSVGILTRAQGIPLREVVVLPNAGLIHRAGPQRLHVDLARRLAAMGYDVFRFDLPGIGDGATSGAGGPQQATRHVFDVLQQAVDARGFVIGGICGAADLGWRMGVEDTRVSGLLLIDPMAVRGPWFRLGQLRLALRKPPWRWPAILLGLLGRGGTDGSPGIEAYRDWPAPDEFVQQAAAMLTRGVRILAIYTGGVAGYLTHVRQIDRTFRDVRRHPRLSIDFQPELDHILFASCHRRALVDGVAAWMAKAA